MPSGLVCRHIWWLDKLFVWTVYIKTMTRNISQVILLGRSVTFDISEIQDWVGVHGAVMN